MDPTLFFLFVTTTIIVVFSPGPAAITVTSQGAGNGFLSAYFGIFGVAAANAVYFVLSATGIAALIIASHTLFTIIKWAGVAYLIYLGATAIFSKSGGLNVRKGPKQAPRKLFLTGFIVEFANPKALLYFAAILPQFLDVSRPIWPQILMMGLANLIIDVVIYSAYAYLGHRLSKSGLKPWVTKSLNTLAGSALWLAAFKMMKVHA